ncbi:MAG: CoA transferase [Streptosporangiales bacterium]|nr:CoA transferase [Streptosporangiales bacterium]
MQEPGMLAGVLVVDASQLLPGPWAAQVLGDMGAEVVKVEPPGGDGARSIRGDLFAATNRNKRSVVIDLKSDEGRTEFLDLVRGADVVIEGYRPGVVERLGIGYDDVRGVNPGIVYCSVSGYGRDRPDSLVPGHDVNYLAKSGMLSFSGHWGEEPRRPGSPMADLGSASYAAVSIVAALFDRTRSGEGCHLDVSMTDVMASWAAARGGRRLERTADDRSHLYPTNDTFATSDGRWIALGAVEERFWEATRHVLATVEPDLASDRFSGLEARLQHGDELHELVHRAFAQHDLDTWLELFADTDAPVSPVLSLAEAAERELATDSGLVQCLDDERHVVFPVRRNGTVIGQLRSASPALEDTARG